MKSVTILIPVFNEETNLDAVFKELNFLSTACIDLGIQIQPFFSDNYSHDESWNMILGYCSINIEAKAIKLNRNYGYQISLLNAFRFIQSDALCILQSDLQDPPEVLLEMIKEWKRGCRSVAGIIEKRSESKYDQAFRRFFYGLVNLVSEKEHPAGIQDFYIIDKSIYTEIRKSPLDFQFIRSSISSNFGFSKTIPYTRRPRISGKTKFNFSSKYNLALDGILSNTTKFRRYMALLITILCSLTIISIVSIGLAFALGWRSPVAGWVSMVLLQLFVLMCLSLFGLISVELMSRLYHLQSRPTHVGIESKINF